MTQLLPLSDEGGVLDAGALAPGPRAEDAALLDAYLPWCAAHSGWS